MTALRVTIAPPRLHIFGLRVHHGLTGAAITIYGLARGQRRTIVVGALLALEDLHDWPWSLFDGS